MMAKTPEFRELLGSAPTSRGRVASGWRHNAKHAVPSWPRITGATLVPGSLKWRRASAMTVLSWRAWPWRRLMAGTLLIAKLDRLSRVAHFLIGLERSGVNFVACDNPQANRLTIGILALVAEQEREAISQRTKAALAAYKSRGGTLGNPNGAQYLREGRARWLESCGQW